MSRQKLFNMIKSRGLSEVGRNSFDLTNRHVYTQKAAKITPVKAIKTYPKDFFNISMREFTQNNIPLNTAAFVNGIKEMSAYFVPFNSIWHNFNQYMATREDPDSAVLQEKGISYEPRFELQTLYSAALELFVLRCHSDFVLQLNAAEKFYAATASVYPIGHIEGDEYPTFEQYFSSNHPNGSVKDYIDFQKKYFDDNYASISAGKTGFYAFTATFETYLGAEHSVWDDSAWNNMLDKYPDCSLLDGFTCYETYNSLDSAPTMAEFCNDRYGTARWCDWLQKLDMLGYGNLYPEFKTCLNDLESGFDKFVMSADHSHLEKVLNEDYTYCYDDFHPYLLEHLKVLNDALVTAAFYTDGDGNQQHEYVNIYPLYAYNKVFYDMFRNSYYDLNYNVRNYNVDFLDCNSLAGSIVHSPNIPYRFYSLETHQWKKDMFTGVLPDNQLGDVSSLVLKSSPMQIESSLYGDVGSSVYPTFDGYSVGYNDGSLLSEGSVSFDEDGLLTHSTGGTENNVQLRTPHTHPVTGTSISEIFDATSLVNVLALKRAEAIQQYRQDLMRAGNKTKDIFAQVFGSSPKSEMDEVSYFCEVESNPININPIIATADTGQSTNGRLGDIAARATISGNDLHFKFSTEDFGTLIFLSYIVPDSFYNSYRLDPTNCLLTPEAHGMKYFMNLGLQPVIGSFLNNMRGASFRHMTRGFAPPYIERKTDIDLVHGNLVDSALSPKEYMPDFDTYQGALSHWVVARTDLQQSDSVTLSNFYIDPRILDNVFQFLAGDDYDTDHFITYCEIKVDAVRQFSEIGLPRFV